MMAKRYLRSLLFAPMLCAIVMLAFSSVSFGQVGIAVSFGPPPLPVYDQPLCPGNGYLWVPGYWAYDNDFSDYYWVPGTWVTPPQVGLLWTPGYWGWNSGQFVFNEGYWAPEVGFYGGINYGFGYFGEGFGGGRWDHGQFFYNQTVNNVNSTVVHNVYKQEIVNKTTTRVSFNGGNGGVQARPTSAQEKVAHEKHVPPVAAQTQHIQAARSNRDLRASVNQGKPAVAATPKPGAMNDRGVAHARQAGGVYHPPAKSATANPSANRGGNQPNEQQNAGRRNDRPGSEPNNAGGRNDRPSAADRSGERNTGNQGREAQQSQERTRNQREQERPNAQQKKERPNAEQQERPNARQKEDRPNAQPGQENPRVAQQRPNGQAEQRHQQTQPRQQNETKEPAQSKPERKKSEPSEPPKEKPPYLI